MFNAESALVNVVVMSSVRALQVEAILSWASEPAHLQQMGGSPSEGISVTYQRERAVTVLLHPFEGHNLHPNTCLGD